MCKWEFVFFINQGHSDNLSACPEPTRRCLCFQLSVKSTTHTMVVQSVLATPTTIQSSRITYAPNAIFPALLRHALSIYATYKKPPIPIKGCSVTHAVR